MALFNKGVVLKKLNRIEEAKEAYLQSIDENDEYSYTYLNLSIIYKEENNLGMAIKTISRGILKRPEEGFLYYNRGCFYNNLGCVEEAIEDLKKCIEIYAPFVKYIKKDKELQNLMKNEEFKAFIGNIDSYEEEE